MRRPWDTAVPSPPDGLRRGPFSDGTFRSRLHDERTAAILGRALGIAFGICLLTGLVSHYSQHVPGWLSWPTRPVWGYRLTQGVHVATGIASIPLLLAKLWTVYPRLFGWPPARTLRDVAERLSLGVLVAAAGFQLLSGLINIQQWYPWKFFFTTTHFWVSWLLTGAVLLHIAVKWPQIRRALGRRRAPEVDRELAVSRRGFLWGVAATAGAVTVATVGQTIRPLERLAVLAPRRPSLGQQGLPVNRTARQAGVTETAAAPGWTLQVDGPSPVSLTLEDLRAMTQRTADLPISCVEGWSAGATWSGVRLRDICALAGIRDGADVRLVSLEEEGLYRSSEVQGGIVADPLTLVALDLNGEPLSIDHGYPARLISPNRPGVLQTKWLRRIEVLPA